MGGWAAAADATIGRVVRVDGGLALVMTEERPVRASFAGKLLAMMSADPTTAPCAGDWCVLREWPDRRITLETVLPRRTTVVRATTGEPSGDQVLCSNIDSAAVVDVRAEHLVPGRFTCRCANNRRTTGQHRLESDPAIRPFTQHTPVARARGRRRVGAHHRQQFPGETRPDRPFLGHHQGKATIDAHDTTDRGVCRGSPLAHLRVKPDLLAVSYTHLTLPTIYSV